MAKGKKGKDVAAKAADKEDVLSRYRPYPHVLVLSMEGIKVVQF